MRSTLVLSVRGNILSLAVSLWSSEASCSNMMADRLSLISGWKLPPGDDILRPGVALFLSLLLFTMQWPAAGLLPVVNAVAVAAAGLATATDDDESSA